MNSIEEGRYLKRDPFITFKLNLSVQYFSILLLKVLEKIKLNTHIDFARATLGTMEKVVTSILDLPTLPSGGRKGGTPSRGSVPGSCNKWL